MHYYKYGIVVHRRVDSEKWRIAFLDGIVSRHQLLDANDDTFNFDPSPGDSVKAKFEAEDNDQPSTITLCDDYEWIRDVEVIDSIVVIFVIAHLSESCLKTAVRAEHTNDFYYIIQNEDTDFRRIAIPKPVVDKAISSRCSLQKQDEPIVYRIGVSWDPFVFEENINVKWRHHKNTPIVPIFELYFRENTLPYLSDSMIYGVLEGIVIDKNETGVLFWTSGMGCVVLSNVTRDSEMPSLGCVNYVLARRCLPEKSFGFPCCYELLPETRETEWNGIKILTDEMTGSVYIEAHCQCVPLDGNIKVGLLVPHLGPIYRGLDRYKKQLSVGKSYYFRIEFQKENNSRVPVIVDLCLVDDGFVQCQVVHVSQETRQYYAVLEPRAEDFERIKRNIDFIAIPFRVLFCAKGVRVEPEELLLNCYTVRVRRSKQYHDVVEAIHVENYEQLGRDSAYSVINKTVWLRTLVRAGNDCTGPIELICPRLEQQVVDFNRLSAKIPRNMSFAVHAQFTLTDDNVPVFCVRFVASTIHSLPKVTSQMAASLASREMIHSTSNAQSKTELENGSDRSSVFDIQDLRDELDNSYRGSSYSSADVVITESWAASPAPSIISHSTNSERCDMSESSINSRLMDQIATESCYASSMDGSFLSSSSKCSKYNKTSAINVDKMRLDDLNELQPSFFRQNDRNGFGRSNLRINRRESPNGRRRRQLNYGLRELDVVKNHGEILIDIAYRYMSNRLMFVEHENIAKESWFRKPMGKVTTAKKTIVFVIPIEMVKCRTEMNRDEQRFTDLIRFIVTDTTINGRDSSVVVPVGGVFPEMPKSFQLGERYKVDHFSFATDKMCRFGGLSKDLKQFKFYTERPLDSMTNKQTMENSIGQQFLRFTINVFRPCEQAIKSEIFELWNCSFIPGLIIVEKKPELMKILEPMDPENEESHIYSAVIEPVAGGPFELSLLKERREDDDQTDLFVFWRLVVEFSDIVSMPKFIKKREKEKQSLHPRKREVGSIQVKDYGMWETLNINTKLAQEKLDLLRSLNDPRVRMNEGPELKPEIKVRKVDVDERRDKMFTAMDAFFQQLPKLKSKNYFNYVFEDEFTTKLKMLKDNDDDFHPFQTKKRSYSLDNGMNYLTEILLQGNVYRSLNEETEFIPLLKVLADCIGLNATYIRKTNEVNNMLNFFRRKKMITYI